MSIRTHKRQRWQLVCADFARAGTCKGNATFIYEYLLEGVLDNISAFVRSAAPSPHDEQQAALAIMRAELQAKQKRLDELADDMMVYDDATLRGAYERFKARVSAEEKELREAEGEQVGRRAAIPAADALNELEQLRAQMDQLEARQRIQVLIDGLVSVIFLHEEDRLATVVLHDGLMAFKLDKKGKLIGNPVDALAMVQPKTYMMADGTKQTFDPRPDGQTSSDPLLAIGIQHSIEMVRLGALRAKV